MGPECIPVFLGPGELRDEALPGGRYTRSSLPKVSRTPPIGGATEQPVSTSVSSSRRPGGAVGLLRWEE